VVSGIRTVIGGSGNDVLRGDEFDNVLHGGGGHDLLRGGAGNDDLSGQGGRDVLMGDAGDDELYGQGAPDLLVGGVGADFLDGGLRPDIVISGTTSHDSAPDVLAALLEAWFAREGLTKQERITALTAGIPFDGFTVKLDATTVAYDSSVDGLMNSHGEDWLWMRQSRLYPLGGSDGTFVYDRLYLDPIEFHPPSL
jgi:Ca2+-binding RTX toxin-like protein